MAEVADALAAYWQHAAHGRFFEAHEALEPLWWEQHGHPLLHGLILLAAGLVSAQRGRIAGALRHLDDAEGYLRQPAAQETAVPVAALLAYGQRVRKALVAAPVGSTPSLPEPTPFALLPPPAVVALPPLPVVPEEVLRRLCRQAVTRRRDQGLPVTAASWAPLCREVLRQGIAVERDVLRRVVRSVLAEELARGDGQR